MKILKFNQFSFECLKAMNGRNKKKIFFYYSSLLLVKFLFGFLTQSKLGYVT